MADRPTRERVEEVRAAIALERAFSATGRFRFLTSSTVPMEMTADLLAEIDALRSDLATARRDALNEAVAEVNARMQTEAVTRDRAYAAGRTSVGSHRQAGVEVLEDVAARLTNRARAEEGK